jgi:serine protease AprX
MLSPLASAGSFEEYTVDVAGETWTVSKHLDAQKEALYVEYVSPAGEAMGEEGFRKAVRNALGSSRVGPALMETVRIVPPETMMRVIITLQYQPYKAIKKKLGAKYRPFVDELLRQAQDEALRQEAFWKIRDVKGRITVEAYAEAKAAVEKVQTSVADELRAIGGEVFYHYTVVNAVSAVIPAGEVERFSALPEVALIWEDRLMDGHLNVSTKAISADTWHSNGFTGGLYNVAIVDSGMDVSHPAFSGKTITSNTFHVTSSGSSCYDDNPLTVDDLYGHGTHVGGIVMSQGTGQCVDCRGVAFGLNRTYNLKAAFLVHQSCGGGAGMFFSDAMAAVDWAESQADGPHVYNLSYGSGTADDDDAFAQFWDALVSANGKSVTISAGNRGPYNANFNTPAISYNPLTVANMDDKGTVNRSDDSINSSSTRGPTAAGRKKPDIAAPGTMISSANVDWEFWFDFIDLTGTSMAAPHVAGAYVLLHGYTGSGVSASLRQKALLVTTADPWSDNGTTDFPGDDGPVQGTHWDGTYGWGYMDLDGAYQHKDDTSSGTLSITNSYRLYLGQLPPGGKATAVWNRRALYNNASTPATWYALSDIDLYLRRESDNALLGSSTSAIDNVEQVSPPLDEDVGIVVIKVKLNGTVDGAASEPYGLAIEGDLSPAVFDVRFLKNAPPYVCPGSTVDLAIPATNYGNVYSHSHAAYLNSSAGWRLNTANPQTMGSIAPNRRGIAIWSVTAPSSSGTDTFSVTGTSDSYGELMGITDVAFEIGVKTPFFSDVDCQHPFYGWIEKFKESAVTAGCGADLYCPASSVTREQTAVFLMRALGETPSVATYNEYFDDIANDGFAPYINRLYELGITSGCASRAYCPKDPLTRGQSAVFITKAKGWTTFSPPAPTFTDMPASHPFYGYVERMWRNGETAGCSSSQYCPDSNITRGQMAVFIVKAFLTP